MLRINYLFTLLLWDPQYSWKWTLLAGTRSYTLIKASLASRWQGAWKHCWSTSSWSFSNPSSQQGCRIKVISYSQRTSRSSRLTSQILLCNIHPGYATQALRPCFHCSALVTVTQMLNCILNSFRSIVKGHVENVLLRLSL